MKNKLTLFILLFLLVLVTACAKQTETIREKEPQEAPLGQDSPMVQEVTPSLSPEECEAAYSSLAASLWEKTDFIKSNSDNSSDIYNSSYKLNGTISKDTEFVNNELLDGLPVKIGMNIKDVYKLLGEPETQLLEKGRNFIAYYYNLFMKDYYEEAEDALFYASTSIGFDYDDNESVTKIILYVEGIEEPPYAMWGE